MCVHTSLLFQWHLVYAAHRAEDYKWAAVRSRITGASPSGGRAAMQPGPPTVVYIGMVGMGGWDKPESRPEAITGVGGAGNESTRLQRPPGGRTLHLYPNPKWRLLYPHAVLHPGGWMGKFFSAFHVHYSHDMCLGFSFSVEWVRDVEAHPYS